MSNINRLSQEQKKQCLENALRHFDIPSKYFIHTMNKGKNSIFAIVTEGINSKTGYMSYDEMNAFIMGYARGCAGLLS